MSLVRRLLGLSRERGEVMIGLEPRAMLAADLVVDVTAVSSRFDWLVPGDKITVDVEVTNQGNTAASGQFDLVLQRWLDVEESGLEDLGRRRYSVNLQPGATAVFRKIALIVAADFTPGSYFLAATAEIPTDSATPVADEDESNNTGFSSGTLDLTYRFGTFFGDSARTTRKNLKLVVVQPDAANPAVNETVTYSMGGPGYAEFQFPEGREGVLEDGWIQVSESTTSSAVTISVAGGDKQLTIDEDVVVEGSLRSFKAQGVSFVGADVIVDGSLNEFVAADMRHSSVFVGAASSGLKFTARDVQNFALDTATGVSTLKVTSWSEVDVSDEDGVNEENLVSAPWIGTLTSTWNFDADISTSGLGARNGVVLSKATVGGQVSGGWSIYGKSGAIVVGSTSDDFVVSIAGSLTAVTVNGTFRGSFAAFTMGNVTVKGSMIGASLLSGLDLGTDLVFGGEGDEQDLVTGTGSDGVISNLNITGELRDSFIGAGFYPGEGEDDQGYFITGQGSQIKKMGVTGAMTNSVLYARSFPRTVKIGGVNQTTALSPETFVTSVD